MKPRMLAAAAAAALAALACAQGFGGGQGFGGQRQGEGGRMRPPSHPLLEKVMKEAGRLRFAGLRTITFRKPNGEVVTMDERILRSGFQSRVEYPAGSPFAGQIIVEDGATRRHFVPGQNEVRVRPMRRDPLGLGMGWGPGPGWGRQGERGGPRRGGPGGPGGANTGQGGLGAGRMQVAEADGGRIAGIDTRLVSLGLSPSRPFMRMWIDPDRGMVLKREMMGPDGRVFAGFEFKSLKYDPAIPARAFVLAPAGAKVVGPEKELPGAFRQVGLPAFRIAESADWKLVNVRKVDNERMKMVVQSYVAKEGGMQVTLFVLKGSLDREKIARLSGGRAKAKVWQARGATLALVGGVDAALLEQIQKLVRPI